MKGEKGKGIKEKGQQQCQQPPPQQQQQQQQQIQQPRPPAGPAGSRPEMKYNTAKAKATRSSPPLVKAVKAVLHTAPVYVNIAPVYVNIYCTLCFNI